MTTNTSWPSSKADSAGNATQTSVTMSSRPIRFVAYAPFTQLWYLRWLAKLFQVIPVDVNPRAAKAAVHLAEILLNDAACLCR